MDNTTTARRTITAEKPNKLRVQTESGMMAANVISDGAKLVTHLPAMQTYTEAAAPASFDAMLQDLAASGGPGGLFILQLLASDPYAALIDGVTGSQYIAREQIDVRDVHHLRFTQQQFNWEMWMTQHATPGSSRAVVHWRCTSQAKTFKRTWPLHSGQSRVSSTSPRCWQAVRITSTMGGAAFCPGPVPSSQA